MDFELVTEVDAENPIEHDIKLVNGQLQWIGGDMSDAESYSKMVAQRIKCRWLFVRGEWYLDQKKGTPWREYIWGKAGVVAGEAKIASILKQVAAETPGVATVDELTATIDRRSRTLSVVATITTDMNRQVTLGDLEKPFILKL